jgi:hypothetical protein
MMVHHLEGQSSRLLSGRSSKDRYFHFSLVFFVWSLQYSLFSRLRLVSSKFIHSILGQKCNITNSESSSSSLHLSDLSSPFWNLDLIPCLASEAIL